MSSNKYTEITTYTTDELELNQKTTFTYKYDSKGNWIKKVEYEHDLPYNIVEREIMYYQ